MGKYRKKPVVIEAVQWFKHGDVETVRPLDTFPCCMDKPCRECGKPIKEHGLISTLEGDHRVCPGDWIITGVKGEQYPCKPDIFEQTYEPA